MQSSSTKSHKNATTPIFSLCCIPPYGELTERSLIWKRFGQRLPNRADRHEEEEARDAVGGHPCSYISSRSSAAMYPYSSRPFPELLSRLRHGSECRALNGDAAVRASPCFYCLRWGERKRVQRFPLLMSRGTATLC